MMMRSGLILIFFLICSAELLLSAISKLRMFVCWKLCYLINKYKVFLGKGFTPFNCCLIFTSFRKLKSFVVFYYMYSPVSQFFPTV